MTPSRYALPGFSAKTIARLGWAVLPLICSSLLSGPTAAEETDQQSLSRIEGRIEREKDDLEKLRAQESSVLVVLERIDADLDASNAELKELNMRIGKHAQRVKTTEEAVRQVSTRLGSGKQAFLERARALYKWQRGGSPFVLLTGDVSALELMRRKRLLEIVLNHDRELIEGLSKRAAELARLEDDLEEQKAELNAEKNKVVGIRASVRRERERKKATLYSVQREQRLRARALSELEQASVKLQEIIAKSREPVAKPEPVVTKAAPELVAKPAPGTQVSEPWGGFEQEKGRLEFPVRGTIIGGFGRRQHPELKVEVQRQGLDIAAPEGEEIRAVERGEVIFSNRLSGYGRMMIIDHGQRYYTVYAHLLELHKRVGDRVQRGEPIAAVGDSGPSGQPRLYFEVRKGGRPIDPAPWFKNAAPPDPSERSKASRAER